MGALMMKIDTKYYNKMLLYLNVNLGQILKLKWWNDNLFESAITWEF